jgi:crotonobetainyl-CoA:carnitine CoA-transferase CaiB-like acyl-CoA transferase
VRHGVGQRVEVDLFHATMAILTQEISAMVNLGVDFTRSEAGIAQPWLSAPFGMYRTADGWIALSMAELSTVAKVFGDPDLALLDAWVDRDDIKRRLDAMTPSRTTQDWLDTFLSAGLWAAPVRSMKEAAEELVADGSPMVLEIEHSSGRPLQLIGCPITLSKTPWRQRLRPPAVGEHTREVLQEVLSEDELTALEEARAL